MRPSPGFLATATITAFLLLLIHALLTLHMTEKLLRDEIGESRIWITTQAEREALQMMMALKEAYPTEEENDPGFRYDLLYSRISLLNSQPQRRYFEGIGAADQVDRAVAMVEALEGAVLDPLRRETDPEGLQQKIFDLAAVLRDLTNVTSLRDRARRFEVREQLTSAIRLGVVAVLGVLLTGGMMTVMLARNMRRLRIARSDLERSRALLEETVAMRTHELREALDVEHKTKAIFSSFIVTVAHQFRTPLAIINMIAQRQVREDPSRVPEGLRGKFSRILEASQRLETLVNGFLSSADTNALSDPGARRRFDFNSAVDGALQRIALEAPDRAITADLTDAPLRVNGDPVLLVQLVQILLSNAVKYSQPGSEVRILSRKEGRMIRCDVSDQGSGIPEEARQSVFERYYRAPDVHHLPGVGLGLPVARAIVAQHGGQITYTSDRDRGTVFTISLPEAVEGDEEK